MSWLNVHATELTAVGSIFMNIATLVIIFFNLNQLRLNNRSLNVDINFKVFELRKRIYKDVLSFIQNITQDKGFKDYFKENDDEFELSDDIVKLKESIDNCKYLFSQDLAIELELFLLNIEQGVSIEQKICILKNKDASLWSKSDQDEMTNLSLRRKDMIDSIVDFRTDKFLSYLKVSNFYKNLMDSSDFKDKNKIETVKKIYNFLKTMLKNIYLILFRKKSYI